MFTRAKRLLVTLALICAGCTTTSPIEFATGETLSVVIITDSREPTRFTLLPTDARYVKLHQWLARNQSGWAPYLGTTPGRGVLVTGVNLRLQFLDSAVLACQTKGACLSRPVRQEDYEFLRP